MGEISIIKRCSLCDIGDLAEFGYTALPKYDPTTNSLDHTKALRVRILMCNHCGHVVLLTAN